MKGRLSPVARDARSLLQLGCAAAARRGRPHLRAEPGALPVLLIPGLMAGDWTMSVMARELARAGHPTERARIGINVGCTMQLVARLERRLIEASRRHGGRIAIVGWSRGGTLGKLVTMRRPEEVACLIALASPNVDPHAVSAAVVRQVRVLSWLHDAGARGVLGADCVRGECAASVVRELGERFPAGVPYTAFYSKRDAVVDWRACCDPAAELIEVDDSHLSIGTDPVVVAAVKERLARSAVPAPHPWRTTRLAL